MGRKVIRYTAAEKSLTSHLSPLTSSEVLVIDCFGLLSSIYHYGDVAYVGGGFGVGIHNLLEAAVWDIPVFFGPNNQKFQEAQALKQNGGQEIHDYKEFEQLMNRFIAEPSFLQEQGRLAGQYVKSLAGATELVLSSVGSRLDS